MARERVLLPRNWVLTRLPTRRKCWSHGATLAGLFFLLQACGNAAPDGQVIAVVNGEEITVSELNEEARVRGIAIGEDAAARNSLIPELVDRKLLAQLAIKQRLDQTPEHLLARRRAEETALVQQLVSGAARDMDAPTSAQVRAAITANPQAFVRRSLFAVERLSFSSLPREQVDRLTGSPSLDALAAQLTRFGVPFSRSFETWDTANLDAGTAARLQAAASGQVTLLDLEGTTSAVAVLSVTPRPVEPGQLQSFATQWLTARQVQERSRELLQGARRSAEIRYQREFEPDR